MLNTTQKNDTNKCFGCTSMSGGIKLTLILQIFMFAFAFCIALCADKPDKPDKDSDVDHDTYWICIYHYGSVCVVSGISIICGAISAFLIGKNRVWLKVFHGASIITTVLFVALIWMLSALVYKDGFETFDLSVGGEIVIWIITSILSVYGNINTHRFIKSQQ
eukprot:UN07427